MILVRDQVAYLYHTNPGPADAAGFEHMNPISVRDAQELESGSLSVACPANDCNVRMLVPLLGNRDAQTFHALHRAATRGISLADALDSVAGDVSDAGGIVRVGW